MPYPAKSIANFFIECSFAEGEKLTPMKAIKLVYVAHGWHLGFDQGPLVSERIQAWKYGPVIDSLYKALKRYGNEEITEVIRDFEFAETATSSIPTVDQSDTYVRGLLEQVWSVYGKLTAVQLSAMTHQDNTPWHQTWHGDGANDGHATISDERIAAFYALKAANPVAAPGA